MIDITQIKISKLPWLPIHIVNAFPECPAIYFALNDNNRILYIGRSVNPRRRFKNHNKMEDFLEYGVSKIAYLLFQDSVLLPEVEAMLILYFKPKINRQMPRVEYCTKHRTTYFQAQQMNQRHINKASLGLKVRRVSIDEVVVKGLGKAIHQAQQRKCMSVSMVILELGIDRIMWHSIIYEQVESISLALLRKIEQVFDWDSGISI